MNFALRKLNEVGVMLGPVTVVVDWVPSFNGSRELLASEFDRVNEESDKTEATYVNVVQRDVSGYLIAWVSYPRETPMLRKMVAGLNQLNFRDSILDVSLVVEGVIVRGFGSGERTGRFVEPRVPTAAQPSSSHERTRSSDQYRGLSKSAVKRDLLSAVLPPGTNLTSQARGYFMSLVSAGRCYRCQKTGHKKRNCPEGVRDFENQEGPQRPERN